MAAGTGIAVLAANVLTWRLGRLAHQKNQGHTQSHPIEQRGFHARHKSQATQSSLQEPAQAPYELSTKDRGLADVETPFADLKETLLS